MSYASNGVEISKKLLIETDCCNPDNVVHILDNTGGTDESCSLSQVCTTCKPSSVFACDTFSQAYFSVVILARPPSYQSTWTGTL